MGEAQLSSVNFPKHIFQHGDISCKAIYIYIYTTEEINFKNLLVPNLLT